MRSIRKIAICFLFLLVGNSAVAERGDACFSDRLLPQQRLAACADAIQDSATSRSVKAYSWLRRGYALLELGRSEEAVESFDQALALYAKYAEAHLGRGLALTDANRLQDAERALTAAITINPDLAEGFNNRGIVYGRLSRLDQAIEDYTQAIRLRSSFSDAFNNRGTAYYEKKFFERAVIEFDEALRISPDRRDILYNRAVSYAALGKDRTAIREFNTILKKFPGYARAYFNRGELHERLGDMGAANRDWGRALELEPDLPVSATIRKAVGQPESGRKSSDRGASSGAESVATVATTDAPTGVATVAATDATASAGTSGTAITTAPLALPTPEQQIGSDSPVTARAKVALIIGNGGYQHVQVLPNPVNDAKAMAQSLAAIGFDIHALSLDDGRDRMMGSLKSFSAAVRSAEVAIVFFAGHGLEVDGNNYMIPVDAKLEHQTDLAFEAIALEQILAVVEEASQLGVVILDACRDNPFVESMQLSTSTRSLARGLRRIEPRRGVLVAYAAKHGTVAYDGRGQHSPYTQALLDHMSTDDLDISLMFRRVSDQVWKATDGRQLPYIYGSLPGDVVALVNAKEK